MRIDRMQSLIRKQYAQPIVSLPTRCHRILGQFFRLPQFNSISPFAYVSVFQPLLHCHPHQQPTFSRMTGGGGGPFVINPKVLDLTSGNTDITHTLPPTWALAFFIPHPRMSVLDVLDISMPVRVTDAINIAFSYDPPNIFVEPLNEATHALEDYLDLFGNEALLPALQKLDFKHAWKSECKSLVLDRVSRRFPLWVKTLVEQFSAYKKDRERWEDAVKWLDARVLCRSLRPTEEDDVITECRIRLAAVTWRGDIHSVGRSIQLSTARLAGFLGTTWLDDAMIDAGSEWILGQTQGSDEAGRLHIVTCLHIQALRHAQSSNITYTRHTLLDNQICSRSVRTLFLPLHVYGNHWTLLQIDLQRNTFSYADCLNNATHPPSEIFSLIQWWLTSLLPDASPLTSTPFPLGLPHQLDSSSCGIIVLDIMAAIILHSRCWTSHLAALHRMEWFLRLSDCFADSAKVPNRHSHSQSF
jgi:hypothetical protein